MQYIPAGNCQSKWWSCPGRHAGFTEEQQHLTVQTLLPKSLSRGIPSRWSLKGDFQSLNCWLPGLGATECGLKNDVLEVKTSKDQSN